MIQPEYDGREEDEEDEDHQITSEILTLNQITNYLYLTM